MLGSFQVRDTAAKLIPILSKKNKALLTILLLAPGYAATRERLSAILWGDKDESQARSSLRQSLAVLRKELGPESPILVAHQDIISLDMRRLRA
ncbi:MAG: winged helix-turn-helix domain-containing protein, partial [Caldilineaceae bacterium]|nr:winged helix-turn-helix domain-containing protein [Caldilineaceae bacterium]